MRGERQEKEIKKNRKLSLAMWQWGAKMTWRAHHDMERHVKLPLTP